MGDHSFFPVRVCLRMKRRKKKIFTGIIYRFINFLKNVFVRVGEVQVFYPVYFMYD